MTNKFSSVLVALLAAGLIPMGCGDDSDNGSGGGGSGGAEPGASQSGAISGEGDGQFDLPVNAHEAVKQCKQTIAGTPEGLSPDLKSELEEICDKAGKGDEDAVRDAQKKVCLKFVEETIPAGAGREQVEASCDHVGAAP